MLPVFTSPLGSKKAILSLSSTLNCLRAPARVLALEGGAPLVGEAPFTATVDAVAAAAAAEFFERIRSAHDFGAALGAGVAGSAGFPSAGASA
jgi:hypothetical protein